MKDLRQKQEWPGEYEDMEVVYSHGRNFTQDYIDTFDFCICSAGGYVYDLSNHHKYNRFLVKGNRKFFESIDWIKWAFLSVYWNGRPTPELIIFEYEKWKIKRNTK